LGKRLGNADGYHLRKKRELLMSERGRQFVDEWLGENVILGAFVYQEENDEGEAEELALELLKQAKERGISKKEIEDEFGDIAEHVAESMNEAIDQHINDQ
jgi:hypothetical protein